MTKREERPKGCPPRDLPNPLAGIYSAVVTPFAGDGGIDLPALEAQLCYQRDGGVRGALVLGTVGEGEFVTAEERGQVVSAAVRVFGAAGRVVAGVQTCDVDEARRQLFQLRDLGADAALVKYLGNPGATAGEVFHFFEALSAAGALPLLYYHYPSHTGIRLSAPLMGQLLPLPGFVGIKESVIDLGAVGRRLRAAPGKAFFTGTALNLTQFLAMGGQGAMCPEAVLMPAATVQVYNLFLQGRRREARAIQIKMYRVLHILRKSFLPARAVRVVLMQIEDFHLPWYMGVGHPEARLKAALGCVGVPTREDVRGPARKPTDWDRRRIRRAVERLHDMGLIPNGRPKDPVLRNGTHVPVAQARST